MRSRGAHRRTLRKRIFLLHYSPTWLLFNRLWLDTILHLKNVLLFGSLHHTVKILNQQKCTNTKSKIISIVTEANVQNHNQA